MNTCFIKPEIINEQQIAQCKQCKFASEKKIWCSKFGFYFIQPEKQIIQPSKKLILPNQKARPPKPTIAQMMVSFTKAMTKWAGSGFKCVSKDEYIRRRTICSECSDGLRCPYCGCVLGAKVALDTEKCPQGKW